MNKIYKVIWSKVRNCYVAVSEIAKRNGKSCTSVNCEGKANRSRGLRMAALTLSVAAALVGGVGFGTPVAWADGSTITVRDAGNPQTYDPDHTTGGTLVEMSSELVGRFYSPTDSSITGLNIIGGSNSDKGFAGYCAHGTVSGHTVTVGGADTSVYRIIGGVTHKDNLSSVIHIVEGNHVIIQGGKITGDVYGGLAGNSNSSNGGTARNNTVSIEAEVSGNDYTVAGSIYGGWTWRGGESAGEATGDATGNSVSISRGKVKAVYGGYVNSKGNAGGTGEGEGNTVSISGGTVSGAVYGGYTRSGTLATKNEVTISGGTVTGAVHGGYILFGTSAIENKVAIDTTVSATDVTVNNSIYGGYSSTDSDTSGTIISGNEVLIRGSKTTVNISGSGTGVFGGYSSRNVTSRTVSKNTVTISDGATVNAAVYGGYSKNGTVGGTAEGEGNTVTISGGTVTGSVFGGESNNGSVIGNKVTIDTTVASATDVSVQRVYGGKGSGNAEISGNEVAIRGSKTTVSISGNTLGEDGVYGGHSSGSGTVSKNTVTISNGATVNGHEVYGGFSIDGDVGGTSEDKGNTVTVSDSTVSGFVMGGRSRNGDANYNSATVNNSLLTSSVDNKFVQGGRAGVSDYGNGTANSNTVTINGSTITATGSSNYASIYGGRSTNGTAASNTVTIIGTTITTSGANTAVSIYGGASDKATGSQTTACNNNTVNLLGASVLDGKGSTNIYGSNETAGTGNELHIGGLKGSTATGSDNIWTNNSSKGTNMVSNVSNFDSIVLHDVAWSPTTSATSSTPALHADTFSNVGTLDITNLKFYDGTTEKTTFSLGETMTLLQSDTADNFSGLKLKYSTADAAEIPDGGVTVKTGAEQTKTEKGVALTYDETHTVALADSDKKVNYTVGNTYKSATLGSMKWSDGGYQFAATDTIDAGGLTASFGTDFAVDGAKEKTSGTLDLLDLSVTTGTIKSAISQDVSVTLDDVAATSALTLSQGRTDTAATDTDRKKVIYTVGAAKVTKATFSTGVAWSDSEHFVATGYTFDSNTAIDASNLKFTFTDAQKVALFNGRAMTLIKNATGLTAGQAVTGSDHTQGISYNTANGTALTGTLTGTVSTAADALNYAATGMTLDRVDLAGWDSIKDADVVPEGWTLASGATVETDGMSASGLNPGEVKTIVSSGTDNYFAGVIVKGANKYADNEAFSESQANVTVSGNRTGGVKASDDNKSIVYHTQKKSADTVSFGKVDFVKDTTLFDGSNAEYNYAAVTAFGTDGFDVSYASPETVAAGDEMTLLKANATLTAIVNEEKTKAYSYTPVEGVTVDASITGKLTNNNGVVTFTPSANQASKLTFTNVDWKDSGALLTRPSNITFAGADVDTTKIHFKNVKELDANRKMTLVSDFGNSVGTITGTKYTVGAGLEGEGAASLSGSDLVFTTKTGVKDLAAQEQTHNTLMVMEAGMAVLAAGNEYVGQTMAELANPQNAGLDGTVTAASLGGSRSRYKTGSHVDSNNWNVAVAVGSKRELKKGSLEWGVFGEYGKANYTLHSDAGRGDGDSHYAGGGLMAKWTNKHDVYTEASVRLGRLSDTASNLLRDAAGNGYGYDVHANYFGAHVGIGKIIHYKGGKSLDVYGKYFYTKRDGVDFASGGNNYSLDSVASSILRVGARYGTTDKKWNWYGGLAYEYEFDGKSEGTVDGVGIRAASIKGGSVRGEIGLRMNATKTNPWQTDISIYGYGGRHRGFGGSVNVAYMF